MQTSGKSADDYVQGNTALLGHDSQSCSGNFGSDDHIDITTGISYARTFSGCDNDGTSTADKIAEDLFRQGL